MKYPRHIALCAAFTLFAFYAAKTSVTLSNFILGGAVFYTYDLGGWQFLLYKLRNIQRRQFIVVIDDNGSVYN